MAEFNRPGTSSNGWPNPCCEPFCFALSASTEGSYGDPTALCPNAYKGARIGRRFGEDALTHQLGFLPTRMRGLEGTNLTPKSLRPLPPLRLEPAMG
jgi:hypothetical protein